MNVEIDITNVRLHTERLILRQWEPKDVGDLFEYASVDGVGQMAGWAPHENLEKSREIVDMFIDEKHVFALEYRGKVIGSLGIEKYNEKELPEFDEKRDFRFLKRYEYETLMGTREITVLNVLTREIWQAGERQSSKTE